jgi:CRP-like cAMP-binding protein
MAAVKPLAASTDRHRVRVAAGVLAELDGEVARVAAQATSVALARGETWGVDQDFDAALVAVEEGIALISTDTWDGNRHGYGQSLRRIVLTTGRRGTLFPPGPNERLEALTQCRITIVSAASLRTLLRLPSVAEAIAEAFAEALRDRHATIRNCSYVRHSERVFEKLVQLAGTYGRVVPDGVRIDFPLTHQLLADMVGSARETVSLALSDLGHEGVLHRQHGRYVLKMSPNEFFSTPDVVSERAALRA